MPIAYDYVIPSRIVFGCGRRSEAGVLARSLGRRAFLVCGSRTLEHNGTLHELRQALEQAGVPSIALPGLAREPLVSDVDTTVATLRHHAVCTDDLLVAIGGGSAIDLAKAAGALVTQADFTSITDYLEGVGRGLKIVNPPLPLFAIPTTAGTGTEATKNAVISSLDPPFKKSLRSELMVPRIALIDPELAISLPEHITAWTGMDAITQLIESYVSRRATEATRQIAAEGLRLALHSLQAAFDERGSRSAREAMAQAALLSGIALANSGLGMAHGVAAALGVHCQVAHGLACAVMLPETVRANAQSPEVQERFASLATYVDNATSSATQAHGGRRQTLLEKIERLLDNLRIPRRLSQIGVRREQIPLIVRDSRGNSINGNPRDVSDAELTRILEAIF